jgi:hypothetical protein
MEEKASNTFSFSYNNKKTIKENNDNKNCNRINLIKGQLKGKLYKLINNSVLLSDIKFLELKENIHNDKYCLFLKKKLRKKNKIKRPFYYAAQQPNLIQSPQKSMKFEDDHLSPCELIKNKFNNSERQMILSFPSFFGLYKNKLFKDLNISSPKNLTEVLNKEQYKKQNNINFPKNKNKSLIRTYYDNIQKESYLNNKMNKTNFISSLKKKSNNTSPISIKINFNNNTSKYCNSYSKINGNMKKTEYYNNISLIERYEKRKRLNEEKSKEEEIKIKMNDEKHRKYFMRKNEIIENYKKQLLYQNILNKRKQIKSQKEKDKKFKERQFIENCINKLRLNYKEQQENQAKINMHNITH